MSGTDPSGTAAQLRRAFDESFAAAALPDRESGESLLVLRVQRIELAVRTSEVAAVSRCPTLTRLPSQNPSVLGLVGLRGGLVVVHSLADLVGQPRGKLDERAILLLCAGEPSTGLLADELLGHVYVEAHATYADSAPRGWSSAIVDSGGRRCPLASVPRFLTTLRQAAGVERSSEET